MELGKLHTESPSLAACCLAISPELDRVNENNEEPPTDHIHKLNTLKT